MQSYDYIIVGSGFGGSVAALRLTEKGYKVLVLESGRRFRDEDFARTNWQLNRSLFMPRLGLKGIMRMDAFRGLLVLSGAGVGGGSLVYANTLIRPEAKAFANGGWPADVGIADWSKELAPYYATAQRMLGAAPAPTTAPSDQALLKTAEALGYGKTFHPTEVAVFFGKPGVEVDDPYFGGAGPRRAGCTLCGGCMIGCRHNAKNTLVKNYLYLAEKGGAAICADSEVSLIRPAADGGYEVEVQRPGSLFGARQSYHASRLILAAGVLGTVKLMLRCRDERGTLPRLSPRLGESVRTNSESLIGVQMPASFGRASDGVAIAAGVNPNDYTKIEAVRYPVGSDLLGLMVAPLLKAPTIVAKLVETTRAYMLQPLQLLRTIWPIGFARRTVILLIMQTLDNRLALRWRRSWLRLGGYGLTPDLGNQRPPPVLIPEGVVFAEKMAELYGGTPGGSLADFSNMSFTAHILGGCPMGKDAATGVIDSNHEVHGYPGLYVLGGAAVPANLGVNPSLTITALAERAMAKIQPSKKPV